MTIVTDLHGAELIAHLQKRAAYFASLAQEPVTRISEAPSAEKQIGNFIGRFANLVKNYQPTGAISFRVTRTR
jgi:hypothetical protein